MWKQNVCNLRRLWEVHPKLTLNISLLPRPRLVKLSFGMYLQNACPIIELCALRKNKLPKSRRERGVMIAEGKQLWIVVEVDMLQVTKVLENI